MSTELPYRIVDVFTDTPLSGNALCVVLEAVPDDVMLAMAREVNLSETTFVTMGDDDESYDVRIFTPGGELPFAGHPTLGTAWVLGPGRWTQRSPGTTVEVEVTESGATSTQPDPVFTEVYPEAAAASLGLPAASVPKAWVSDVGGTRHLLLPTDAAIDRLRPDLTAVAVAARDVNVTALCPFRRIDDATLHTRAFIPAMSVPEDPGTGSAAGAIALLGRRLWSTAADVTIRQGDEMGRPCRLKVHAEPGNMRVGGDVTAVAAGHFTL